MSESEIINKIRIANPFQYLGPLSNPDLFMDREFELRDSYITCEQILRGGVGGILIIGGRGSGKTSFIDALIRMLNERKVSCAKIDLDERMVAQENEVLFIRTILTELLNASKTSGLLEENIIDKAISLLRGIETEMEISLPGMKFIGTSSTSDKQFSYIILRDGLRDFLKLLDEKGKADTRHGAILILDEGDLLTLNRGLMQIMRNVFQNMPCVGLVVTGSTHLLEQVSDVFSPIPRFFRKIELGQYPNDTIAHESIQKPIGIAIKSLEEEGIKIKVYHQEFESIVVRETGRMPLDINLLSHFAWDKAALRRALRGDIVELYFDFDKILLDQAISQLVGTREYASFIGELSDTEIILLQLLSKSPSKATIEELTILMELNKSGDSLQELPLSNIGYYIRESAKYYTDTNAIIKRIIEKGNMHHIQVISATLIGKPMYVTEDHWVRSYFKYGWTEEDVDIVLGIKPKFGGIRIFGEPVASIIHSIFFPRVSEYFSTLNSTFKAHVGENDGKSLRPDKGMQLINCSYIRQSNATINHYTLHISEKVESAEIIIELQGVLYNLREVGLIDAPSVTNETFSY